MISVVAADSGVRTGLARGLAYRPARVPNTLATRFGIASGTKGFTAAAVLVLARAGKLDIETRLADVLPGAFPGFDPAITVRHLLTHTSGIGDYCDEEENCDFEAIWRDRPVYNFLRPADFAPLFENLPAKFRPGERFAYNNAGFIVLGMIVEAVAEMPFADAVRTLVFEPSGMDRAGFFRSDELPADCAVGYLPAEGGKWRSNVFSIPVVGGADGGAFVCAEDMHRYWASLLGDGCRDSGLKDLIMETRVPVPQDSDAPGKEGAKRGYSLGHWVADDWDSQRFYFLTGVDPGVTFLSGFCPADGRSFVVACNTQDSLGLVWPKLKNTLLRTAVT